MVNWDYNIKFYVKKNVCDALCEIGYTGRPPDRRFQNEEINMKRFDKGKLFHLQISFKKSRMHFQLHQDLKMDGYHKGINGGREVYEEKNNIIRHLKASFGG